MQRGSARREKWEELGHIKEKKEEMEGMGWRAKSRCACGCSPDGPAASTRGNEMCEATDSGRKSAKRDPRNNREFVISPRQRRTFAKEKDPEDRGDREDRDDCSGTALRAHVTRLRSHG